MIRRNPWARLRPTPRGVIVSGRELERGINVEHEHVGSTRAARTIALQHLAEDPRYYTKLALIHRERA